jgi:hypothetical protein
MEIRMKAKGVSNGIPRREFLRISSAAALGVAVVAMSDRSLFAAESSGIVPLMGVGYAPFLPLPGYSVPLTGADSLLSPDPHFISSGAKVSVVGAKRALRHVNAPGGVAVDALFTVSHRNPDDPVHYRFFSIDGRPDADSISGQLSFTIQAPATNGVSLLVRRQRPTSQTPSENPPPIETEASPLTLSLGNVAGPKLNRGVYALAFREEDGDSMANWSRMALAPVDGGGFIISGATFSYLLLNVDYADAVPDRRRASRH